MSVRWSGKATRVWRLVRWETGCLAFDLAGLATGLFLAQGGENWIAAGSLLWAVACVSITVRTFRYGQVLHSGNSC